jgi:deoxyxylulose-5-phosphate synthase
MPLPIYLRTETLAERFQVTHTRTQTNTHTQRTYKTLPVDAAIRKQVVVYGKLLHRAVLMGNLRHVHEGHFNLQYR